MIPLRTSMADDDRIDDKIKKLSAQISDHWRRFLAAGLDLSRDIRSWASYKLVVAPYFRYWSYKNKIRALLRYAALSVVSLSTLLLAAEIGLELMGHERLLQLLKSVSGPHMSIHLLGKILVVTAAAVLFAASVGYLLWHNIDEARKPGYEYKFARAVNSFLLECHSAHVRNQPVPVQNALEVCHFIFKDAGVRQASLHLPDGGTLSIRPEHVYPATGEFSETRLQLGEGLAGRVFDDELLHIQYLPRLFFPLNYRHFGWFFPHTAKLRFSQVDVPNTTLRLWDVGNQEISGNVFKRLDTEPILYRSLLSVPVVSRVHHELVGVLNLDFSRTDPLDEAAIAMALVLGLLLGEEILNKGIAL